MDGYFILDADRNVISVDMTEWAEWFEKANRTVAKTFVVPGEVSVSTVFLGLDHAFGRQSMGCEAPKPVVFETLVFGGPCDGLMNRYCTWDEAEAGHADMVRDVKSRMSGANVVPLKTGTK